MAQISAGEISEIIKKQLAGYESAVDVAEVGSVIETGDGIARIYGLWGWRSGKRSTWRRGLIPRSWVGWWLRSAARFTMALSEPN